MPPSNKTFNLQRQLVSRCTPSRRYHLKDDPPRAVAKRTSGRIAAIVHGSKVTKVVPLPSPKVAE
jgi:hypothetical protein